MPEILPCNPRHERHRHEHRHNGEGGCNHRQTDLVGGLNRGTVGGFAHPDMAGDIFNLNNRVVHQNAGGQRQREETDKVQREAQQIHDKECRHRRQRQRHGSNQRRPPVFQEQQHHDHGKQRALQQGGDRGFVVAIGIEHRVVDQRNCDLWKFGPDHVERRVGHLGGGHFAGPLGAVDCKGHHLFTVETGK